MTDVIRVAGSDREPITIGGVPVAPLRPATLYDQGFFGSVATGWASSGLDFADSWDGVLDGAEDKTPLTEAEFKADVGGRAIPYRFGVTRGQTRRAVNDFDRDLWLSRQDANAVGSFLGSLLPAMATPESVLGVAVGLPVAAGVARATAGSLFANALKAGLRPSLPRRLAVGLAAAETELVVGAEATALASLDVSRARTGVADVETAKGTAALPVTPLGAGLGLAGGAAAGALLRPKVPLLRRADAPASVTTTVESPQTPQTPPAGVASTVQSMEAAVPTATAPPVGRAAPLQVAPSGRLDDLFSLYEGGVSQWLRGMSDENPAALEFAATHGINTQPVRELLEQSRKVGALTHARPAEEITALAAAAADFRVPANAVVLRAAGMLDEAGGLLPPFAGLAARDKLAPVAAKLPEALARIAPRFGKTELKFASDVDRAAYVVQAAKAKPATLEALKKFLAENGVTDGAALGERVLGVIKEGVPGGARNFSVPAVSKPRARVSRTQNAAAVAAFRKQGPDAMLAKAGLPIKGAPPEVRTADLIAAIEQGRGLGTGKPPRETAAPRKPRARKATAPPPKGALPDDVTAKEVENAFGPDPEKEALEEFAKENGVDLTPVEATMDELAEAMRACQKA